MATICHTIIGKVPLFRDTSPDFTLNLALKESSPKQHARIEAAFKKLAGMRDNFNR